MFLFYCRRQKKTNLLAWITANVFNLCLVYVVVKPSSCEPNEFQCSSGKCVLKIWRCDADNDCGDLSDELDCAGLTASAVKSDMGMGTAVIPR